MTQSNNPLPEAPFSTNFRMYREGEAFQFTVRAEHSVELMNQVEALIVSLKGTGYAFSGGTPTGHRPAYQAPVPTSGQSGAAVAVTHTPVAQAAVPAGTLSTQQIEGYVVGTYQDKRSGHTSVCIWLFTPRRPFRAFTIYPEQFADLLPFVVSPDVSKAWNGSAPNKEQAQARGVYHLHAFELPVVPRVLPDGSVEVKNGYTQYRPATVQERASQAPQSAPQGPSVTPPAPPMASMSVRATAPAPLPMVDSPPSSQPDDAMGWTMMEEEDFTDTMNEQFPAMENELLAWVQAYRSNVCAFIGLNGKSSSNTQWEMLNRWAADTLGCTPNALFAVAPGITCAPIGWLTGPLADRWVESAAELPHALAVHLLTLTQQMRGDVPNPTYNPALTAAFQRLMVTVQQHGSK